MPPSSHSIRAWRSARRTPSVPQQPGIWMETHMTRKHLALALALSVAAASTATTPAAAGPLADGIKNGVKVVGVTTKVGTKVIAAGVKTSAKGAAVIVKGGVLGAKVVAKGVKDAI